VSFGHDIQTVHLGGPGSRGEERGEDLDEGGLAGAVGAEQAEQFAWPDFEAHAIQGGELGGASWGLAFRFLGRR